MGSPAFEVTGRVGTAMDFDGAGAYVRVPSSASLKLAAGFTIEAWIDGDDWVQWKNIVVKGDNTAGNTDYQFARVTNGLAWDGTLSGARRTKTFHTPQDTGAWIHAIITHDTSSVRCYRGGSEISAQSDAGAIYESDVDLGIAAVGFNGTQLLDGTFDEVRISDIARSADWIAAQNASTTGAFVTYGDRLRAGRVMVIGLHRPWCDVYGPCLVLHARDPSGWREGSPVSGTAVVPLAAVAVVRAPCRWWPRPESNRTPASSDAGKRVRPRVLPAPALRAAAGGGTRLH